MSPEEVGRLGGTALALEAAVTPKPGSVDRDHDFPDTRFEHFLASSVAVVDGVRGAAAGELSLGEAVLKGVRDFRAAQSGGNTHFGALTLLVPLAAGWGDGGFDGAEEAVRDASAEDAALYMRAVREAGVGGLGEREELDAGTPRGEEQVMERGVTFHELMEMSEGDDVARELVEGFPRTRAAADEFGEKVEETGFQDAAVEVFVSVAADGDSFIRKRHGEEAYRRCRARFREVRDAGYDRWLLKELDRELNFKGINPGASADVLGAALFVALLRGWRP